MASDKIVFQSTDEEFDLCLTCSDEVREFIQQNKKNKPDAVEIPKQKNPEVTQSEKEKYGPKRPGFFARKNKE